MSDLMIDWCSAEVRDGRLEVALRGEPPNDGKKSFERTLGLLQGGDRGKVKLTKGKLRVDDVGEGTEDRLRHFLESVVAQANASVEEHEEQPEKSQDAEG